MTQSKHDTQSLDFKAALETYKSIQAYIHPDFTVEELDAIQTALRIADRLQSGDLVNEILDQAIDSLTWEEINEYHNTPSQSIFEDAGGFILRKIKYLFGIKHTDEKIVTYQEAMRRLVDEGRKNKRFKSMAQQLIKECE